MVEKTSEENACSSHEVSIQDLLTHELKSVKTEKNSICQDMVSINTGIKGVHVLNSVLYYFLRFRRYRCDQNL